MLTAVFCIIWPVLTIPAGVFNLGYFYFFTILAIMWGMVRFDPLLLAAASILLDWQHNG